MKMTGNDHDRKSGELVGSRINTAMRGDVLGKLLDGHDVGVLRYGEGVLLLGLHEVEVFLLRLLALLLCLVDA